MMSPSKSANCPERPLIRLVLACGTVCDLSEAMSAAEALQSSLNNLANMSDKSFNDFLMCDSASLRIGKRACPVHPDMQLEVGHLYYVLPIRAYQQRLAWSHISALAAMAMPSSAAKTHVPSYDKSSPSKISKQRVVSGTFARIPDVKFYLCVLLRRRLFSKGKCRVEDMHAACLRRRKGASAHLALDTGGGRAEGAAGLMGRTWKFNNICESPEENSKYVELLIERSHSWRPPLQTIQESLAV